MAIIMKPFVNHQHSTAHSASIQSPNTVVMVRPHHFQPNSQTADDNSFQSVHLPVDINQLKAIAYQQVTHAAQLLQANGVTVYLFEDTGKTTPDSVFPNNWFSTQLLPSGETTLCIFPMYCKNRRPERRIDIIEFLQQQFYISHLLDYRSNEINNLFLEGTGVMVLDHQARIAYAARSHRMNEHVLQKFCIENQYQPLVFNATDAQGIPIYHTNVMMSVADQFVVIALDTIHNLEQRAMVINSIQQSGKHCIEISSSQMTQFAGNVFSLYGNQKQLLVLSTTALASLTDHQQSLLSQWVKLLAIDVSAIEQAGGSIRCMLAGIHLIKK